MQCEVDEQTQVFRVKYKLSKTLKQMWHFELISV